MTAIHWRCRAIHALLLASIACLPGCLIHPTGARDDALDTLEHLEKAQQDSLDATLSVVQSTLELALSSQREASVAKAHKQIHEHKLTVWQLAADKQQQLTEEMEEEIRRRLGPEISRLKAQLAATERRVEAGMASREQQFQQAAELAVAMGTVQESHQKFQDKIATRIAEARTRALDQLQSQTERIDDLAAAQDPAQQAESLIALLRQTPEMVAYLEASKDAYVAVKDYITSESGEELLLQGLLGKDLSDKLFAKATEYGDQAMAALPGILESAGAKVADFKVDLNGLGLSNLIK